MSIESAISYIHRMRSDDAFHQAVNERAEDEDWEFLSANSYEFTMQEFRAAQDAIYKEYDITPM